MSHCKIFKVPTVTQERALLLREGGNRTRALRCGEVGGVMGQCIRERLSWGLQISRRGFSRGLWGTKAQEPGGRRQLTVVHMGQPVHRSEYGPVIGKPGGVGISSKSYRRGGSL